jgi:SAM-dependent methyltransferase
MNDWYQEWFNKDYLNLYCYHNASEAEMQIHFLMDALQLHPKMRALDLGCGTGRHSIALAKKGLSVLGLDSSPFLLDEAQKQKENHPNLSVQFQLGDMRDDFSSFGNFDLVISMFTSFGYFEENKENEKVLENIRNCLKLNGKFFFDYMNPGYIKSHQAKEKKLFVKEEEVLIKYRLEDDFIVKDIIFPGRSYQERVHLYEHRRLKAMLKAHRFKIEKCWGQYNASPWHEGAERQLFYCTAI